MSSNPQVLVDSQGRAVTFNGSALTIIIGDEFTPYQISDEGEVTRRDITLSGHEFDDMINISSKGMSNTYQNCDLRGTLTFANLESLSGDYSCISAFQNCTKLEIVTFPSLEEISGLRGLENTFYGCDNLEIVRFPVLEDLSDANLCFYSCFANCQNLTDIYFNSLTTTSFGSSYKTQFTNMIDSYTSSLSNVCTIHFPSNLVSTISSLDGYPRFGGSAYNVKLAFDLPATS